MLLLASAARKAYSLLAEAFVELAVPPWWGLGGVSVLSHLYLL